MADGVISELPCGSEYPVTTTILYSLAGCAGLVTLVVAAATFVRLITTSDGDTACARRRSWQLRFLHYVQLIFSILCAVYGILHPISLLMVCSPSFSLLSLQSATKLYWCIPMVRLSDYKQIENVFCSFLT